MSYVLTVHQACKRFAGNRALAGASLQLERAEWLALLGPNGAGKTTLVRAIAGRVELDAGGLTLFGTDLTGAAASGGGRQRLGVVPQEIALYPRLTARENLTVFGELRGLDRRQLGERIDWALAWTGLADRADQVTESFSGGMKRRLNLAVGVLHQPDVVLLDEPTVGVDPQSRERIWEMLRELRRDGASLLLTTHQLDEAQQLADRIVILDHGRDVASGTFDELVHQTIGSQRRVSLMLAEPLPGELAEALPGELAEINSQPGELERENGGHTMHYRLTDIAAELPPLLMRVAEAGGEIVDVQIEGPTLQAVFIHLTGRELRE